MTSLDEKRAALSGMFTVHDSMLTQNGKADVLLVDDLFHTGASMEAACAALRSSRRIGRIYVAAVTWR